MDGFAITGLVASLLAIACIAVPWVIGQRHADRLDRRRPVKRQLPPNVVDLAPRRSRRRV